jgi:hypothetical protein
MEKTQKDRFTKVTNLSILIVLVVIAGLLASLFRIGSKPATKEASASAPEAVPAPVAAAAAPAANLQSSPTPPLARKTPSRTPQRNYTQAGREIAPANPSVEIDEPEVTADLASEPPLEPAPSSQPMTPEPEPAPVTVAAGTILTIRLIDQLQSDRNRPGDPFVAALDEPIFVNGVAIVPRGATVEGRVVATREAGRVSGVSELSVELNRLLLSEGQSLELVTDTYTQQGEQSKGSDAAKIGAGAAIGAVIGAIGGGGKGAAIGAATGAGAGTAGVLITRGKPVILPPETRLSFQLQAPVEIENTLTSPSLPTSYEEGPPRLRRQR